MIKNSFALASMFLVLASATQAQPLQAPGAELQSRIDAAPNHGTVTADRNAPLVLSTPLVIRKPLTLQGLNAELPPGLGKTPLVAIEADGVSVTDFELRGNADSVDQKDRNALLEIRGSNFRIERGTFLNSAKDGIMVDGAGVPDKDIVGGVIRDIVGRGNIRDLVSIGGGGEHGRRIRNVLVDNVRGYDSKLRGAVEVSDGTENITVRNVYAENSVYGVDVQDHGKPLQINTNVRIEGVTAVDCTHILRTANRPHGHAGLTIRDAVGLRCAQPLKISNTRDLTLDNVRISEHPAGEKPPIAITNSDGVSIRDVVIRDSAHEGAGLLIENTSDVRIDGLVLLGDGNNLTNVLRYRITEKGSFAGLRVHGVAGTTTEAGIVLEKGNENATLTDVVIAGNASAVDDQFHGARTTIESNTESKPATPRLVQGEAWKRHVIDNTSDGADGTRLADFNGDGLLDIATPWEQGGVIRVYPHPGRDKVRTPWPAITVGQVKSPEDAVFHDLDGDGALDVVSSTEGEERALFIHWSPLEAAQRLDGAAWQTVTLPQSRGKQWMYVAPAQVDGQHGPDLVAAGKNEDASIGWFQAPADPRNAGEWQWKPLRQAGWVMSIVNVDLDGDGDLDILYSDRKGDNRGVWWLEHPDAANVDGEWAHHAVGGLKREAMFLDVGYLDADGVLDIASAVRDGGILLFSRPALDAAWTEREIPLPADGGIAKSVSIADVDGNGHNDLVVSTVEAKDKHAIFWLDGTPGAHWAPTDISGLEGTKFDRVEPLDVDGDGDLDFISSEEVEKLGVFWYENPRIGAVDEPESPPVSPLAGQRLIPTDVDWEHPVYSTTFDDPAELSRWVLEGGKGAAIESGLLVLESTPPVEGEKSDHLVYWLNEVFPADFLLEFSIRPQNRKDGLAIVFFNARGINGESIFDPALKSRDGVFKQYHSGDLNNYHISYWAGDRGTANIRKNAGFNLVATGPDLVTSGAADAFQTVRIYKKGGSIRLIVDDVISAAWDDDGVTYGPVHTNDGWIGLRQMEHAIRCEYDHLKVYPLLP